MGRLSLRALFVGVAVWMTAVLLGAFLMNIPNLDILEHTARNLYFHVPLWFAMIFGFVISAYYSVRVLGASDRDYPMEYDVRAEQAAFVGSIFGLLGLATGMVWARFTWYLGSDIWWNFDPKQTMAAVQLLIYGAYFTLRSSLEDDPRRRARVSAVYNVFAASTIPFLIFIVPRRMESLHPGAEGNPAFSDITDPRMRLIFYPAILAFFGLFYWLYRQRVHMRSMEERADRLADSRPAPTASSS